LPLVVAVVVVPRFAYWDQPLAENAVGRQIPTAMVARNLSRGSGFLNPELDTGPFPNRFLVEPPVYQGLVVAVMRVSGLSLEASGRVTSALGFALGCVGLWLLVRRRMDEGWAYASVAVYALLPVCIRYGRAFQPDPLAVGLLLSGAACWDACRAGRRLWLALLGWVMVAAGLAVKLLGVFVLVPLALLLWPGEGRRARLGVSALLLSHLLPVCLWYAHAWRLLGEGSRASAENAGIWLSVLLPTSPGRWTAWQAIASNFLIRAFTPLGAGLALLGAVSWRGRAWADKFWAWWGASACVMLAAVAAKLHHEYYALWLAPVVAIGCVMGAWRLAAWVGPWPRPHVFAVASLCFVALSLRQSWSTWQTPPEWRALSTVPRLRSDIPPGRLVVAREAVLYALDRRGMRLEQASPAIARALGEWGVRVPVEEATPAVLLSWYDRMGATFWVDVGDPAGGRLTHEAARTARGMARRILIDEPGLLAIELDEASDVEHTEDAEAQSGRVRHAGEPARLRAMEGRAGADHGLDGI
jgi:4-amino-4-deoxy-L-arabinose transferase-like glycosyltransferase